MVYETTKNQRTSKAMVHKLNMNQLQTRWKTNDNEYKQNDEKNMQQNNNWMKLFE